MYSVQLPRSNSGVFVCQVGQLQQWVAGVQHLGHGSPHAGRLRLLPKSRKHWFPGEQLRGRSGQTVRVPEDVWQDPEDCGLRVPGGREFGWMQAALSRGSLQVRLIQLLYLLWLNKASLCRTLWITVIYIQCNNTVDIWYTMHMYPKVYSSKLNLKNSLAFKLNGHILLIDLAYHYLPYHYLPYSHYVLQGKPYLFYSGKDVGTYFPHKRSNFRINWNNYAQIIYSGL